MDVKKMDADEGFPERNLFREEPEDWLRTPDHDPMRTFEWDSEDSERVSEPERNAARISEQNAARISEQNAARISEQNAARITERDGDPGKDPERDSKPERNAARITERDEDPDKASEQVSGPERNAARISEVVGDPGRDPAAEGNPGAAQDPEGELSVEEAFAELDRLVRRMESEGISLEESFACYEKGIRLVRYCNDRIDRVEKKVQLLRGEGMADGVL